MPRILGPDTFTSAVAAVGRGAPDMGTIITVTGVATTTSGNVSASFQLEGSNDGLNWFIVGAAQAISSAASPQTASFVRVQFSYAHYRIYCTALTGTGAQLVTSISVGA